MTACETESGPVARVGHWTMDFGATHHLCSDRNQLFASESASSMFAPQMAIATTEKGSTVITTIANGVKKNSIVEGCLLREGH